MRTPQVILLGGMLSGFFTATEAAAVACLYALFLGFVVYRTLHVHHRPGARVRIDWWGAVWLVVGLVRSQLHGRRGDGGGHVVGRTWFGVDRADMHRSCGGRSDPGVVGHRSSRAVTCPESAVAAMIRRIGDPGFCPATASSPLIMFVISPTGAG